MEHAYVPKYLVANNSDAVIDCPHHPCHTGSPLPFALQPSPLPFSRSANSCLQPSGLAGTNLGVGHGAPSRGWPQDKIHSRVYHPQGHLCGDVHERSVVRQFLLVKRMNGVNICTIHMSDLGSESTGVGRAFIYCAKYKHSYFCFEFGINRGR